MFSALGLGGSLFGWDRHFFKPCCGDILPLGHDPVAERTTCGVRGLSSHRETGVRSLSHVECVIVIVLSEEHVVAVAVNDGCEIMGKLNLGFAIYQVANAEVFKPALWALHAVEATVRSVRKWHNRLFGAGDVEVSVDLNISLEKTSKP